LSPEGADSHIIKAMKHQIELDFKSKPLVNHLKLIFNLDAVDEASKAISLEPTNGSAYYLRGYNRFDLQVFFKILFLFICAI
jgi:hypothetical protein